MIAKFLFFSFFLASIVQAQTLSISLHEPSMYFPGSEIPILLTLENSSAQTLTFRIADNRIHSFEFEVKDSHNKILPPSDVFVQRRLSENVYYRDIRLEPGDRFSFLEDLSTFTDSLPQGSYVLTASFYPQLYGSSEDPPLSSESIRIIVRGFDFAQDSDSLSVDPEEAIILEKVNLSPGGIIEYMLSARQVENWPRFFLYLDIESLYQQNPTNQRRYNRSSQGDRRALLTAYQDDIKNGRVDSQISFLPIEFSILHSTYSPQRGEVLAELKFDRGSFWEVKNYTYFFEKRSFWTITAYEVENVRTEAANN